MKLLSKPELTKRLGSAPEAWTFLGQCYDAGPNNGMECALLQQPGRVFFTLKPAVGGKGRVYVSAEGIDQFKRWNPDLYVKLNQGLLWLQLRSDQANIDRRNAQEARRLKDAERRLRQLVSDARFYIKAFRASHPRSPLSGPVATLNEVLHAPSLFYKSDESRALAFEQKSLELEAVLLKLGTPAPTPQYEPLFTDEELAPAQPTSQPIMNTKLTPVIDIGF